MTSDHQDADLDRLRSAHARIPDPDHDQVQDARRRVLATVPATTTSAPRRLLRRPRRLGLLALIGILVGGTAVAATTPWSPQIGPWSADPADRATSSRTAVPAQQLRALSVLRREQTDRDRSAPTEDLLRELGTPGQGLRLGSVRLLRNTGGSATVLASIAKLGEPGRPPTFTNALCVSRTTSRNDRAASARSTVDTDDGPIAAPVPIGGSNCGSFADLLRGRIRTVTTGLVPDGVARVRVQLRTGRILDVAVRDNFYELPVDVDASGASPTSPAGRAATRRFRSVNGRRIDWIDIRGQVVPRARLAREFQSTRPGRSR